MATVIVTVVSSFINDDFYFDIELFFWLMMYITKQKKYLFILYVNGYRIILKA